MSFLTAASERSSNGSGVSGVSEASFSGASSFSFSFCAALVLLAIRPLLDAALRGPSITLPLPYAGRIERPVGAGALIRPELPRFAPAECRRSPLKPRLSLHYNRKPKAQLRFHLRAPLGFPAFIETEPAGPRRLQNPRSAPRSHRATPAEPSHPATRNSWPRRDPGPEPVLRL